MADIIAGRFEVLETVGEGRQGMVFRARDLWHGTVVALKRLRQASFNENVRVVAHLRHPNLVAIVDLGVDRAGAYVVLEYVEGPGTRDLYLSSGEAGVREVFADVCLGLHYAHGHGICHGDLKPENVLIDVCSDGRFRARVTDFGLCRAVRAPSEAFGGTVAYAAPECLRGDPADHRSDLYSLGVALFETITGALPFTGPDARSIADAHLQQSPPDPQILRPEISADLRDLVLLLLAKQPTQRPSSAAEVAARLRPQGPSFLAGEPAWIPRPRAAGLLAAIEKRASEGHGQVALICGEEGSGKSSLLREVSLDAGMRGTHRVLIECADLAGGRSVGAELLRRCLSVAGNEQSPTGPSSDPPASEAARHLIEACRTAAHDRPVMILVDDLDQGGDDIIDLFRALWPMLASERVLLVATSTSTGLAALKTAEPRFLVAPHVHRVTLRPFTNTETRELLGSLLTWPEVDPELASLVRRSSGGNPGLTCEVTRALIQTGELTRRWDTWVVPDTGLTWLLDARPSSLVASRLSALDPEELHVLGVLALIGGGATDDMLARVTGREPRILDTALSSLESAHLVKRQAERWILRHDMVRDAAIASLTAEQRLESHARAVEYLTSSSPDQSEWVESLARHLMGAGRRDEAREVALAGGDAARQEGRYGHARALYSLACKETLPGADDVDVRARWGLASCHIALGQWPSAVSLLSDIVTLPPGSRLPPDEQISARLFYARALSADGQHQGADSVARALLDEIGPGHPRHWDALAMASSVAAEAQDWGRAAGVAKGCLDEAPGDADELARARVENTLGVALLMQGDTRGSLPYLEASLSRRAALGEEIDAGRCALNLAIATRRLGQYDTARRYAQNAVHRFGETGAVAWQAQATNAFGMVELHAGAAGKASLLFQESFRLATAVGRWRAAGLALNNLGMALRGQGEWGKAAARFHEALRIGRLRGDRQMARLALINLGDLHAGLAELDEAASWYFRGKAEAERDGNALSAGICELGLARVHREQGELDRAEEHSSRASEALEHAGDTRVLIYAHCERSELRLQQGRANEALEAAERAGEVAEMGVYERAMVLRLRGRSLGDLGRTAEASEAFQTCLALLEPTELVYGLALARLAVGRWLTAHGPVASFRAAERYLALARDAFRKMGAPRRVAEVEAELDRPSLATGITGAPGPDSRKLSLVDRMLSMVNAPGDSADALQRILDLAVHAVHAQRGMIILVGKDTQELAVRAQADVDGVTIADAQRLSARVVRSVAEGGNPVFSADALLDSRFSSYESIKLHHIACFMCVPLMLRGDIIGTIYLDSCSLEHRFTQDDVTFLQAFADHAAIAMENLRHREEMERENAYLQSALRATHAFDTIVGISPAMQSVYQTMVAAARSTVTVLIQGATGTGKELVARAIHYNGSRAGARFVPVNCAAFTDALLESELFGHVKGAFTGAIRTTKGLFQVADGGTIFLDEVADMSPGLQAKVLRVLEMGEVKQVGHPVAHHVDVRIICATNRDLETEVHAGRFRADLYYRLKVVSIRVPPLRDRPQDIPLLATHFLKIYRDRFGSKVKTLSEDALVMLCRREWPGNVRELEHTIEAAVALCQGRRITTDTLSLALGAPVSDSSVEHAGLSLPETRRAVERHCLAQALNSSGWNVSAAARNLGIDRRQLQRLMRRYGFRSAGVAF